MKIFSLRYINLPPQPQAQGPPNAVPPLRKNLLTRRSLVANHGTVVGGSIRMTDIHVQGMANTHRIRDYERVYVDVK